MVVRDVGPMDGLEIGMLEKSSGMCLEGFELIRECRELEGDIGCHEAHLLIVQMAFGSQNRHWLQNLLLATEEVRQGFFIQACVQPSAPIVDQAEQLIVKKRGPGDG